LLRGKKSALGFMQTSLWVARRMPAVGRTRLGVFRTNRRAPAELPSLSLAQFRLPARGGSHRKVGSGRQSFLRTRPQCSDSARSGGAVTAVAFTPDAQGLISVGEANRTVLWNVGRWDRAREMLSLEGVLHPGRLKPVLQTKSPRARHGVQPLGCTDPGQAEA